MTRRLTWPFGAISGVRPKGGQNQPPEFGKKPAQLDPKKPTNSGSNLASSHISAGRKFETAKKLLDRACIARDH